MMECIFLSIPNLLDGGHYSCPSSLFIPGEYTFSLVASSLAFVTRHQKPLVSSWVWWLMSVRPELRRLKQKDQGREKLVFRGDS